MAKFIKTKSGNLKKKESLIGSLFVILAGAIWGCTGLFVRYFASIGLDSSQVVVFKITIPAVIFFLYCLIFNRKALRIKLKDIWVFLLCGLAALDIFSLCYFYTIEQTSLSVAAVLLYLSPAIVMLISAIIFKEKITKKKLIACVMAILGCFFVSGVIGTSVAIPPLAFLTGIIAAVGYGFFTIFGEIGIRKGYSPLTISTYTTIFAIIGVPIFLKPAKMAAAAETAGIGTFIIMAIIDALVSEVIPCILYTKGLEHVSPAKASIMASVEPVCATLLGIFVLGESIDVFGILGIVFVVGAIVLLNAKKIAKRNKKRD